MRMGLAVPAVVGAMALCTTALGEVIAAGSVGIESTAAPAGVASTAWIWSGLALLSVGLGLAFRRFRAPACACRPISGPTALILLGMMVAGGYFAVQFLVNRGWAALQPDPNWTDEQTLWNLTILQAATSGVGLAVGAAWLWAGRPDGKDRAAGSRFGRTVRSGGIGLIGFLVVLPWVFGATELAAWARRVMEGMETPVLAHESLRLLSTTIGQPIWWVFVGLVVLVVPVVEEIMYRGLIQGFLKGSLFGGRSAIMISSVIFVCMHIGAVAPAGLMGLFVLSMGLGMAYDRSGSLVAPVVMHALFNAVNVAMMLMLQAGSA